MSIDEFLEEIKHRTGHVYMYIATGINVHSYFFFFVKPRAFYSSFIICYCP